jgi:hypothetical protein
MSAGMEHTSDFIKAIQRLFQPHSAAIFGNL